tara:strand:+ start:316 stop:900 length:585 start_codon:yes stop_codon:yes gene_type:complete
MTIFTGEKEADYFIMSDILDNIEFYSGTDRRKMMTKNNLKHPRDGGSMLYGYTWKSYMSPTKSRTKVCDGVCKTKIMDAHPELQDIFKEYAQLYFPEFEYGQVQMNKNFPCPPHRDSANMGESVLCTFGDYIGGLTCIDIDNTIIKKDTRGHPSKFDGSKYLHWVETFKGTRYSLVFFHNRTSRIAQKYFLSII